jgi:hypothetical protein
MDGDIDWLVDRFREAGVPVLARSVDHGNPGVLVTGPDHRLLSVYVTRPHNTFVDPPQVDA